MNEFDWTVPLVAAPRRGVCCCGGRDGSAADVWRERVNLVLRGKVGASSAMNDVVSSTLILWRASDSDLALTLVLVRLPFSVAVLSCTTDRGLSPEHIFVRLLGDAIACATDRWCGSELIKAIVAQIEYQIGAHILISLPCTSLYSSAELNAHLATTITASVRDMIMVLIVPHVSLLR